MVDVTFFGERGNHDSRYPRTGPPAVSLRRRHMIPPTAVFVVRHNNDGVCQLRPALNMIDNGSEVTVAGGHIGIASLHIQAALRLIEGNGRSPAGIDIPEQAIARRGGANT